MKLADERMTAFLSTAQPKAARRFYEGVLGLAFVLESEQMLVFDTGPARVTLAKADAVTPRLGTTLGWNVKDLRGTMRALADKGVVFERFDGMEQDELGVWSPTPGQGVAWFKDPDGNLLSVSGVRRRHWLATENTENTDSVRSIALPASSWPGVGPGHPRTALEPWPRGRAATLTTVCSGRRH